MSVQDEMDRAIDRLEHEIAQYKAIRAKQQMQETASPRVVAGPLRFRDAKDEPRVLTHPSCLSPCAVCDDDGRPDGEAA